MNNLYPNSGRDNKMCPRVTSPFSPAPVQSEKREWLASLHPALAEMLPLFQPAQVRHSMHTWRSFIKRPRYEDVTCGPGYSRGQLVKTNKLTVHLMHVHTILHTLFFVLLFYYFIILLFYLLFYILLFTCFHHKGVVNNKKKIENRMIHYPTLSLRQEPQK